MEGENTNENDIKALLEGCANSLLSAVSRIGRNSRTNAQTSSNSRSETNVSTTSTYVSNNGACSAGTGSSTATVFSLRSRPRETAIDDHCGTT